MILPTIALLLLVLLCLPIRTFLSCLINLDALTLDVSIRIFGVKILKEHIYFEGGKICCRGTFDTSVGLTDLNTNFGKSLYGSLTVDSIAITSSTNMISNLTPLTCLRSTLCGIVISIVSKFVQLKTFFTQTIADVNCLDFEVLVRCSLLEVLWCLICE